MHILTIVIYVQFKFNKISFIGYLVMAENRKKSLKLRQSKGINSTIANRIPIKFHVHNFTMVIYIQYKIHWIPSLSYLDMAEDEKIIES